MDNPVRIDALTGLGNRQAFEESLHALFEHTRASSTLFSLAYLDVDNFTKVNGEHGHAGGDAVLKGLSALVQKHLSGDMQVFRYGGDEFSLLFPEVEREQAFLRLERIRAEVEAIAAYTDEATGKAYPARVTITAGIAAYPIDGEDENALLRKADAATYRAKVGGRNKIMLAYEERMIPKTAHFTQTQLERLAGLAKEQGVSDAVLLREALDDLLVKYRHGFMTPGERR
ncbi:MAG: diguanylate cyclase domain-containing protein [Chloroflexota bacterium]